MARPPPAEVRFHRRLAAELFNSAWDLLERKRRSADDDLAMIHAAHASRYHWGIAGTPENVAIGEWQVSRVYSVLRRGEPALFHARKCLEICKRARIDDFPLAFAYEALARASAVAGRRAGTARST